ncbi:hypothetical protein DV735_g3549, partial [Chaetothyriales sp. CBS 134920]
MPVTRPPLRENITYSQAKEKETNVLHQLGYHPQQTEFSNFVRKRLSLLQVLVGHHLGLSPDSCHAADWDEWMHGSFNLYSGDLGPYLLLDYVEERELLSKNWNERHTDEKPRTNLFHGLSKILLALSRIPLPQIDSFVLDDNGFLQLLNRPLTLMLQDLENEQIHISIPKGQTFSSIDSYVNALLSYHDSRMKLQPNAAMGPGDCVRQMTALSSMRTVAHHHFEPSLNHGPFVFCLTDLYPWNILVDECWNIKCILDLAWAASLPIEFMRPPEWLTNQAVDVIDMDVYDALRKEFMPLRTKRIKLQQSIT